MRGRSEVVIVADWVIQSADQTPIEHGAVCVDANGTIIDVGDARAVIARHPQIPVHDGSGHVLAPGFVNAHVHLYGVLAHGIPLHNPPADFWGFLRDFWWPKVEDALDVPMILAATDWVCAEMLRSGTTSFYDILEAPNALPGALVEQKQIIDRLGMRGIVSFEATERVSADNATAGLDENMAAVFECRADPNTLVDAFMCVHTTFTCSPSFLQKAHHLAAEHDMTLHAHVNEGVHEGRYCEEHYGKRTMEHYLDLGIAGPRLLASQCVQISPQEQEIIAATGVRTVHMPLANCEVGGGIAPVPEQLAAGVVMGLGSDGYVNDFFSVMRGAALLHKARLLDPGVMPANVVFGMATEGGARALGLADKPLNPVGRLDPGWGADLQLIQADFPTPPTAHNLFEQVVLWRDSRHVRDVMVDGRWRVLHGVVEDFDVARSQALVHEHARRLWAKA